MIPPIERDSPVPYYEQLFGILKQRIVSGAVPADERLPSELELGREFGLSRATVRQTLQNLETEGLARRVPRRGVFAAAPERTTGWTVQDTAGFLDSQLRHGRTGIATRVVDARSLVPPEHVAQALRLAPGTPVFALERVRSLDGVIAMFSTNWFPSEVARTISTAQDVLDGSGSVDSTLRRAGFTTDGAHRIIRSMRAPQHVATQLQIGSEDPVLRVRSSSWNRDGFRFDYYETWVLTDVVPLEVLVSAS